MVWLSVRYRNLRSERRRLVTVGSHMHGHVRRAVCVYVLWWRAIKQRRRLDHLRRTSYSSASYQMLFNWSVGWVWSQLLSLLSFGMMVLRGLVRNMLLSGGCWLMVVHLLRMRVSSLADLSIVLVVACLLIA